LAQGIVISSHLWLREQDFVRPEFCQSRERRGVPTGSTATIRPHIAPPPGTLVLLARIAVLAGRKLKWGLRGTGQEPIHLWRSVALAPSHTGIAGRNEIIIVVALCTLGILDGSEGHDSVAGVIFGAACSLKPHIAAFLLPLLPGAAALEAACGCPVVRCCPPITKSTILSLRIPRFLLINLQVPLAIPVCWCRGELTGEMRKVARVALISSLACVRLALCA